MSKSLQIGSDIFEYPETGDGNWGEEATAWAEAVTKSLETVQGPQDILLTESILSNGGSGNISGLSFNTSLVQQIEVKGLITRTYLDATPTEAEAFHCFGAYNGTEFRISTTYTGLDSGVVLDVTNAGQFTYEAQNKANTDTLTIKFKANTIIQD